MSSSGTTGSDGRTYSSDGKGNVTVVDNSGKTVYSGSVSNSGAGSGGGSSYTPPDFSNPTYGRTNSGGGGGSAGLSWHNPATGETYYNIDSPDSSYQREGINGGVIPADATRDPNAIHQSSSYRSYDNAPSLEQLASGQGYNTNYLTGGSLWLDNRFNNAQRSMITANQTAVAQGGQPVYSLGEIQNAGGVNNVGWAYSPGREGNYSYYQPGTNPYGQNFQSFTYMTDPKGDTYRFRGYANDPRFGAYNDPNSGRSPQDMEYSWERTGGAEELLAGTYKFNPAGAAEAAAQMWRPLAPANNNVYTQTMQLLDAARGGTGAGGYYDANKGYYVGAPGASDMQRTFDAIDYYRQNNMLDRLQAAQDYANRQGYVNNASNAHLQSSDWVGNVYPGARWDPASRSIVTGDGRVLREGVDFAIGSDDRAYVLPGAGARTVLAPGVTVPVGNSSVAQDVYNTTNEWLNAWKDMQNQFAGAMPPFNPPARESFRFTTPPPSITSGGGDIHIPTLAAKQQWEAEQDAVQNQYAQKYGANYNRAQDIYNTQLDWLKAGMTDTMRQEEIAREAARYQAEVALEREKDKYNRALAMWQSGVGTDEIYRTLGIPEGTRPFEQVMAEWEMELTEREFALDAAKAARSGGSGGSGSGGGSGGGGSLYSAAINEMLAGQSRHRQALLSGEKRSPHSYNYYVSQAIELSSKAGKPLSRTEIDALRKQADYLTKTDDDWVKAQIAAGRLPQRRPITDNYRE